MSNIEENYQHLLSVIRESQGDNKDSKEKEDLEIPSFLRNQSN